MADLLIKCPKCNTTIPVEVVATIEGNELMAEPDLADVWAHAWACSQGEGEG